MKKLLSALTAAFLLTHLSVFAISASAEGEDYGEVTSVATEHETMTDIDQIRELLTEFIAENELDAKVVSSEEYPGYQPIVIEYSPEKSASIAIFEYTQNNNIDTSNVGFVPIVDGVAISTLNPDSKTTPTTTSSVATQTNVEITTVAVSKIVDTRAPDSKLSDGVKKAISDGEENISVYLIFKFNDEEIRNEAEKRTEKEISELDESEYNEKAIEEIKSKCFTEVKNEYINSILNEIGTDISKTQNKGWLACTLDQEQINAAVSNEKILGIFLDDTNYYLPVDDPLLYEGPSNPSTTTTTTTTSSTTTTSATTTTAAVEYFASIDEMVEMAKKDYQSKTGVYPASAEGVLLEDGSLSIAMYDETGALLETYVVDPATGNGKAQDGEDVELPQTGLNTTLHGMMIWGALALTGAGILFVAAAENRRRRRSKQM